MADFRIWGRIEEMGPRQFLSIASAVREDLEAAGTRVLSKTYPTREAAELALREFMTDHPHEVGYAAIRHAPLVHVLLGEQLVRCCVGKLPLEEALAKARRQRLQRLQVVGG